jgi:hypothetical protein
MARCWLCNKKYGIVNMISSTTCWSLWKVRNSLCFQGDAWLGMKAVLCRLMPMLWCWKMLIPVKMLDGFEDVLMSLERVLLRSERISLPGARSDSDGNRDLIV